MGPPSPSPEPLPEPPVNGGQRRVNGSYLCERCIDISGRLRQRNELMEEISLHFGRRKFFLVTGFKVGSVSFRKYRNGDIPFRNRLFPEKIRYDVKVIDVLALIEDEEKFSKVSDEDAMRLCLLLSLEKDNEKFHPVLRGREKGRDAALFDRVRDLEGICERLLTLPKEIKSLKVRIFKLETIIQFSLYPTVITLKRECVQKEENLKKFFQKEELLQDISDDEPHNKDDTSSEKMANRITAKSLVELDTGVMNLTELAAFYGVDMPVLLNQMATHRKYTWVDPYWGEILANGRPGRQLFVRLKPLPPARGEIALTFQERNTWSQVISVIEEVLQRDKTAFKLELVNFSHQNAPLRGDEDWSKLVHYYQNIDAGHVCLKAKTLRPGPQAQIAAQAPPAQTQTQAPQGPGNYIVID
ncbi:hypothetical protein Tco_1164423 [Tanacetum coccineum]